MKDITRRGASALSAAAVLGLALPTRSQAGDPEAQTSHGRVRGLKAGGVNIFRGIRYGADTGPARFQAPKPPAPWSSTMAATAFGAASPQRGNEGRGTEAMSEDCLFLNVWTPGLRDGARRPVLFYIHGGAYSTGSGSHPLYDGVNLATQGDVVVVTVNHRINLFGYLYLAREAGGERFTDSGNAGQLDLILALQWVKANIAEFGGDPGNVTLFGQSGGGAKIATLSAMPAAKGLFHKMWTMSGQQVTGTGPLNASKRTRAFLEKLRAAPADLLAMPSEKLLEGLTAGDPVLGFGGVYVGPVLDAVNLPRHPFFPDAAPQSRAIPMVIGNTHDETRAFLGGDPHNFELTWDEVVARLPGEMRVDISPEYVVAEYRRLYPNYSPSDVFFAASTAGRSWRGAVEELNARARAGAPTWGYQLNFNSPRDGGRWRAYHTLDIPLVFGNLEAEGSYTGTSAAAKATSEAMSGALLALAKTGNPNHRGMAPWPMYELARRPTMTFDGVSKVENDPRGAERRLFEAVPYVQPGT